MDTLRFNGSAEVETAEGGKPYRLLVIGEAHRGELLVQNVVPLLDPATRADDAAVVAQAFHESYERLAPEHGYETREASAKPWEDVPEQNRGLMVATAGALLDGGVIAIGGSGSLRTAADAEAVKRRVRETIDEAFHEWRPDHADGAACGDLAAKIVGAVDQVLTVELGLATPAEAVQS